MCFITFYLWRIHCGVAKKIKKINESGVILAFPDPMWANRSLSLIVAQKLYCMEFVRTRPSTISQKLLPIHNWNFFTFYILRFWINQFPKIHLTFTRLSSLFFTFRFFFFRFFPFFSAVLLSHVTQLLYFHFSFDIQLGVGWYFDGMIWRDTSTYIQCDDSAKT